jgi:proline utilization trans-activator
MAQLYALNLDLEESVVGNHEAVRGRRIWWTVYALDKKLTLNQGLPNIIDDRDIRSPWPRIAESDEDRTAMAIHTKMCRLVGKLMSHVYSYTEDAPKSLISTVQAVLEGAADVNEELRAYKKRCFGEISRVLGTLELTYHHCIIIACRPALYSLLRRRFEPAENPQTSAALTPSMTGLLQACVDSAGQTVQFLSQLEDAGLLGAYFLALEIDRLSY